MDRSSQQRLVVEPNTTGWSSQVRAPEGLRRLGDGRGGNRGGGRRSGGKIACRKAGATGRGRQRLGVQRLDAVQPRAVRLFLSLVRDNGGLYLHRCRARGDGEPDDRRVSQRFDIRRRIGGGGESLLRR